MVAASLIVAGFALIAVAVYAGNSLRISNTASTIAGAPNLFMVTGVTGTTVCASTTGYSDFGLSISWGTVVQGATYVQYVCLENTGSPHTLTVTNSLPSSYGTLTATIGAVSATGQTIAKDGFALVTFVWAVDPSAPITSSLSFNISVL